MRLSLFFLIIPALLVGITLNFSHLEFLRDNFDLNGKRVIGYWIYAEKHGSSYVKVGAKDEGVTCVDDVARAAILYLELYKKAHKEFYAERAIEALNFLLSMQDDDGDFYNFLQEDGKINKFGVTSRKSANWWAARAFWAVSMGANVLKDERYKSFRRKLLNSAQKVFYVLKAHLKDGLLEGYTDRSSLMVLGLYELYNATKDEKFLNLIKEITDAIVKNQVLDGPFKGLVNEGKDDFLWHGWGSRQLEVFVKAYEITKDERYLEAARNYSKALFRIFPFLGPIYEIRNHVYLYPQLSYAMECAASGLVDLYKATGDINTEILAYLIVSFLYGNNGVGEPMIGENGEGYDGLHSIFINKNSGAESTISALRALEKLSEIEERDDLLHAKTVKKWGPIVIEAEKMDTGISDFSFIPQSGGFLHSENGLKLKSYINLEDGRVDIYAFMKGVGKVLAKVYLSGKKLQKFISLSSSTKLYKLAGTIDVESGRKKLIIYLKPQSGYVEVDQILIVPKNPYLVFKTPKGYYRFDYKSLEKVEWIEKERKAQKSSLRVVTLINEGRYYLLDLKEVFNNDGIIRRRHKGNFDNPDGTVGAAYPWEEIEKYLKDGKAFVYGVPFIITENESGKDNITLAGQVIELSKSVEAKTIYILGSSDHGNYCSEITLCPEKGPCTMKRVCFTDWCEKSPLFGEKIAMKVPYRYISTGDTQNINPKIFLWRLNLEGSNVKKILLPVKPTMHVFAITIETAK